MLNLFKNFGKGILYVLVLPFLLVGLAIYGVVALFIFIYLAIKGLILFFTGRSLYEDLPEDKEAKRRLALANGVSLESEPEQSNEESEPVEEAQKDKDDIDNDPFYMPHYLKEEDAQEESVEENETSIKEAPIEEEPVETEPIKNEEIPAKNQQNSAFSEISEDDDDDSDDSGITINFE